MTSETDYSGDAPLEGSEARLLEFSERIAEEMTKLGGWCAEMRQFADNLIKQYSEELRPQLRALLEAHRSIDEATQKEKATNQEPPKEGPAIPTGTPVALTVNLRLDVRTNGGGMGFIYECTEDRLDRTIALKVMRERVLREANDPDEELKRFDREAMITARINHPAVVPIFALGRVGELPCYAMKLLSDKRTFNDEIARYWNSSREISELRPLIRHYLEVCKAIDHAHREGFAHCDLKPKNLAIDKGQVYVLDWGLAREIGSRGSVGGTPGYYPPEASSNSEIQITRGLDIYCLGGVLYHMLTGCVPTGPTSALAQTRISSFTRTFSSLGLGSDSAIPIRLERIYSKAMMPDPIDRFASAEEVAIEIQRWLEGESPSRVTESRAEWLARTIKKYYKRIVAIFLALSIIYYVIILSYVSTQNERAKHLEQLANKEREDRLAKESMLRSTIRAHDLYLESVVNERNLAGVSNDILDASMVNYKEYAENLISKLDGIEDREALAMVAFAQLRSAKIALRSDKVRELSHSIEKTLLESERYIGELLKLDNNNRELSSLFGTINRYKVDLALKGHRGNVDDLAGEAIKSLRRQILYHEEDIDSFMNLGMVFSARASFRLEKSKNAEAIHDLKEAVAIIRQGFDLAQRIKSTSENYKSTSSRMLAICLNNLASVEKSTPIRIQHLEEALAILRRTSIDQDALEFIAIYRSITAQLKNTYNGIPHHNKSIQLCREWISELDHLPITSVTPKIMYTISSYYNNIGTICLQYGLRSQALLELEQGEKYFRQAYSTDPTNPVELQNGWRLYHNKASAHFALGEYIKAIHSWSRSLFWATGEDRDHVLLARTHCLIALGRIEEAMSDVESLRKMDKTHEFLKARVLAKIASATRDAKIAEQYSLKAIALLRNLVSPRYSADFQEFLSDPNLKVFRDRPEFRALLTDFIFDAPFMGNVDGLSIE